jgi:hypothetical protein
MKFPADCPMDNDTTGEHGGRWVAEKFVEPSNRGSKIIQPNGVKSLVHIIASSPRDRLRIAWLLGMCSWL